MSFPMLQAAMVRCAWRRAASLCVIALLFLLAPHSHADGPPPAMLGGHVLPNLAAAARAKSAAPASAPVTLTIVLRRSDEAGFERYLADVYDPASPAFRRFLRPTEVSDRFGPSVADYVLVKSYFAGMGFSVAEESANRVTLTITGTRGAAEHALAVDIGDYTEIRADGTQHAFFANANEPTLPAAIADKVHSIAGLSNLAKPDRSRRDMTAVPQTEAIVKAVCTISSYLSLHFTEDDRIKICNKCVAEKIASLANSNPCGKPSSGELDPEGLVARINGLAPAVAASTQTAGLAGVPPNWIDVDGTGQRIGLVEFDRFDINDVADYFDLLALPQTLITQLSEVHVGGGAPTGPNAAEVLLDIDFVMPVAPGANVAVYDAPFSGGGSFQSMFNRMVDDGMTIISNSWTYCEDQTTAADVQGIDAVLATAAASGISVFNASGDTGSTCLDGSANTIGVPSDAPHATAVGGSSQASDDGAPFVYTGETWWNGSSDTPVTGQGGFGVSRFFSRPSYQDGFTSSTMRSVPDVVAQADPVNGIQICQASDGGCPAQKIYGGTSMSAPSWAAYTALLNQAQGTNLGFINPALYPLSGSTGFHSASSMGSDFAHVGIGSPNVNALHVALAGQSLGIATVQDSQAIVQDDELPADGSTTTAVVIILRDANGNTLSGKTVTLSANAGSHVSITPSSVVTNPANGAAVFTITDATIEPVTFVAHDTTDGVTIPVGDTLEVVSPPATSAGIMAFPTTVAADGVSTTTITITLHDAQNHPSPGKVITLSQGEGRSVVTGPDPPVSDSSGQIAFTATDRFEETVTYTAVDVTDGDLPVPGSAVVTYSGSAAGSCATAPTAADGYAFTSFINGFASQFVFFGNVNFGCAGASAVAFDANGNGYVAYFPTGALYRFPPEGGAATAPLSTLGPTLSQPVFGSDGRLYATHSATTGDFTTGDLVEIDPATGAQIRVLATNLTCPQGLATDPLSGDLFFDDACTGAGSDNPSVFRVSNPASATPTVSVYATMPATPNGALSIAPDGTIYVVVGYYLNPFAPVYSISGTDQPMPPIVAPVAGVTANYWVKVGAVDAGGTATSLIVLDNSSLETVDLADTTQRTPLASNIGAGTIGTDGCMYPSSGDAIYRLAPIAGACDFATTNPSPALALSPRIVQPNPTQGGTQTLTATFSNIAVPADTPVYFQVDGANAQTRFVRTDANGTASVDYQGVFAGDDVVTAFAAVGSTNLVSNPARVTWDTGPHATLLRLTSTGLGAVVGQPVALSASLVDFAVDPQLPVSGATIAFSVGGQVCSAATGSNGIASCSVTIANPGAYPLTASYAGSAQFLASSDSRLFVVPTDGIDLIFADGFDGD